MFEPALSIAESPSGAGGKCLAQRQGKHGQDDEGREAWGESQGKAKQGVLSLGIGDCDDIPPG